MPANFASAEPVQKLLDRASGLDAEGGDPRLKAIMRDLLQATADIIVKHDISESEFWQAAKYLADGAGEIGLIIPGIGLEHFLDLYMDAKDAEAGLAGGTPRTIEGPLYVSGAPLVDGTTEVELTSDPDDTDTLHMTGTITGPDGEPVKDAILHVWHANSQGCWGGRPPYGIAMCQNEVVAISNEETARGTNYPNWHGYVKACFPAARCERCRTACVAQEAAPLGNDSIF